MEDADQLKVNLQLALNHMTIHVNYIMTTYVRTFRQRLTCCSSLIKCLHLIKPASI